MKAVNAKLVLEGERIFLRPVTIDDVSLRYCSWLNDPEVNRYLETRFSKQTLESVRRYVVQMTSLTENFFLAIILREDNRHIGNIKLGPVNREHRRGELSFFVGEKDCWGQGYATEAVQLMSDYALKPLGLMKITAGCYSNNIGSKCIFEKAGYILEGVFKKHYLSEGSRVDRLCYSKFQEMSVV